AITISFTGDNVLSGVISTADPTTICAGETINLVVDIVGGSAPYEVVYTDGTNVFTVPNYTNGSNIPVMPTTNATYSLMTVEDVINCPSMTVSGSVGIVVEGPVTVTTDPSDVMICNGEDAVFLAAASVGNGGSLSYQWQESADGGSTWADITDGGIYSGANTIELTISGATNALDANQYRLQVNTLFCSTVTSAPATLTVEGPIAISVDPANTSTCDGGDATFSVTASGGSGTAAFQWEESTDGGTTWTPVSDGGIYSGATTNSLLLTSVTSGNNGSVYRVQVSTAQCAAVTSSAAILTVEGQLTITTDPVSVTICESSNAEFTVAATGGGTLGYQWEESTDGGTTWAPISDGGIYSGTTTDHLTLAGVPLAYDSYQYRVLVNSPVCNTQTSINVVLLIDMADADGDGVCSVDDPDDNDACNPDATDTDLDGICDAQENIDGTDP
ncbi:MAG TPA: hypothetical protein PKB07_25495, partial [Flavilitoribacter sp.]|nr:hypothetical protein [Flavilitoribacter sp.]